MSYRVLVDSRAARNLQKLPKDAVERIDKVIAQLSEDPRPPGVKTLRGRFKEGWRIRVGEYRLLYRIDGCVSVSCISAGAASKMSCCAGNTRLERSCS